MNSTSDDFMVVVVPSNLDSGYLCAPVVDLEQLKKYVMHKILTGMPEAPFCTVCVFYCYTRLIFATLGLLLSGGISFIVNKHVRCLKHLLEDAKKGDSDHRSSQIDCNSFCGYSLGRPAFLLGIPIS
ncbi:hypothetical protein POM88_014758 [Heracleum sosnowskyi]|uniref:Uncharacterized protein n=1 Tax=Heracleum sosnowskyi TaxID=360622 RepID=A0AAD8MRA3_9APIA|nr:hypothetical protein POM88_014758 [Heracleum sosnowskyi]